MSTVAMIFLLIIAILTKSALLNMIVYTWSVVSITLSVKAIMDIKKERKEVEEKITLYIERPVEVDGK